MTPAQAAPPALPRHGREAAQPHFQEQQDIHLEQPRRGKKAQPSFCTFLNKTMTLTKEKGGARNRNCTHTEIKIQWNNRIIKDEKDLQGYQFQLWTEYHHAHSIFEQQLIQVKLTKCQYPTVNEFILNPIVRERICFPFQCLSFLPLKFSCLSLLRSPAEAGDRDKWDNQEGGKRQDGLS